MSEVVVARLVAAVFALMGVSSLAIGGEQFSQDQLTTAAVVLVTAVGSIYGGVRTWRRGRLTPTSKHALDPTQEPMTPVPPKAPPSPPPPTHDVDAIVRGTVPLQKEG